MGFQTPNIDRIANEGAVFSTYYGQQSCTAGRAAFITGQSPFRTGLTKVGLPGAPIGLQKEDPTIAEMLKPLGYMLRRSSARTTSVTATSSCPRRTASTSSSAISTTSTPRRSRRTPTIRRIAEFRKKFGPRGVLKTLGRRQDRGHRAADPQAHGDGRRGVPRGGQGLHGAAGQGQQAVLRVVQLDPHARQHASQAGVRRQDRPRPAGRRHGRARRPWWASC